MSEVEELKKSESLSKQLIAEQKAALRERDEIINDGKKQIGLMKLQYQQQSDSLTISANESLQIIEVSYFLLFKKIQTLSNEKNGFKKQIAKLLEELEALKEEKIVTSVTISVKEKEFFHLKEQMGATSNQLSQALEVQSNELNILQKLHAGVLMELKESRFEIERLRRVIEKSPTTAQVELLETELADNKTRIQEFAQTKKHLELLLKTSAEEEKNQQQVIADLESAIQEARKIAFDLKNELSQLHRDHADEASLLKQQFVSELEDLNRGHIQALEKMQNSLHSEIKIRDGIIMQKNNAVEVNIYYFNLIITGS